MVLKSFELLKHDESLISSFHRKLVLVSRGERVPDMYWEKKNGEYASGDDISVIAVSLKEVFYLLNGKSLTKCFSSTKVPT